MTRPLHLQQPATPLASTRLQVNITDLVAEHVICHRFENTGKESIEAVFSFPIPLDAAFLGMQATLAGETIQAQIQPKAQADRTYDDAIAEGHSAALLTTPEPGLVTIILGNLLPSETGEIQLRFATMLRVADKQARFSLPLVHRPRYGKWRLEELETPTHDFAVEHPMAATIVIRGLLAAAPVTCTTHAATFTRDADTTELSLNQAMLDRDLVLNFDLTRPLIPVCHLIEDGDESLGLASFVLPRSDAPTKPLDLCLVLDCSGSMNGDAIDQSRLAVSALVGVLADNDRIQILRFGSSVVPMFRRPLLATTRVRQAAQDLVPTIDSDLGGTEMGNALERALADVVTDGTRQESAQRSRAIILVTDGAVQPADIKHALKTARRAGVRIFVVAVGSSAGAEVLSPLAEATGAILERAVPTESIDAGVMRQLRRAREVGAIAIQTQWPGHDAVPISMGVAYPGDATNIAATLPRTASGDVLIEAPSLGYSLRLPLGPRSAMSTLRALLGQQRYRSALAKKRGALALQYSLLTKETSAVLVKHREMGEQNSTLPHIVRIPEMVPDGMVACSIPIHRPIHGQTSMTVCESAARSVAHSSNDYLDMPAFLRRSGDDFSNAPRESNSYSRITCPLSAAEVRAVLLALYRTILERVCAAERAPVERISIVNALPADVQTQARELLLACRTLQELLDQGREAVVLLVLHDMLDQVDLTDDQEAALAVALARHPGSSVRPGTNILLNIKAAARRRRPESVVDRGNWLLQEWLEQELRSLIQ